MSQVPPSREKLSPPNTQRAVGAPRTVASGPRPVGQPPRGPMAPQVDVGIFDPSQRTPLMILGGLIVLLVAAYWDMLALTSAAWTDDLYSHGWIIPLFSAGLFWLRWQPFQASVPAVERWIGLVILAIG